MKRIFLFLLLSVQAFAASSVTQNGITWTFDTNYTTGTYANGDSWVVAPSGLTITSISPASTWTSAASATVTITNASPAVVTWTAHGLSAGQLIKITTTGTLPTGLTTVGGNCWVYINTVLTANTFTVTATLGGAAINTSSAGSGTHTAAYGRIINGSMVNPIPRGDGNGWPVAHTAAFDSCMFNVPSGNTGIKCNGDYNAVNNVARPNGNDLSGGNNAVIAAGSSLVSSISNSVVSEEVDSLHRAQLQHAAILTVVSSSPSAGQFRPPMYGTDKSGTWNKSSLNYSILSNVASVSGAPTLATAHSWFAEPVLMINMGSNPQYIGPSASPLIGTSGLYGQFYGQDINACVHQLNITASNAAKEPLYIDIVQQGIDIYGALTAGDGAIFPALAGLENGRKLPLLLAGLALNDATFLAWADKTQHNVFSEDLQTFIVGSGDVSRTPTPQSGRPLVQYIAADIGLPEWGEQYPTAPGLSGRNWGNKYYNDICGSTYVGEALACSMVTGANAAWNNAVFFNYTDRYMGLPLQNSNPVQTFDQNMWNAYRGAHTAYSPQVTTLAGNGTTWTLQFWGQAIDYTSTGNSGWIAHMSGGDVTLAYSSGRNTPSPVMTGSRTVASGETGTISYTRNGNTWQLVETAQNDVNFLASTPGDPVTNKSTQGDVTPPSPNPSTIASTSVLGTTSYSVTATTATDANPPVQYSFSKDAGSNWTAFQTSSTFTFTGLSPATTYPTQVKAEDSASTPNVTTPSASTNVTTSSASTGGTVNGGINTVGGLVTY